MFSCNTIYCLSVSSLFNYCNSTHYQSTTFAFLYNFLWFLYCTNVCSIVYKMVLWNSLLVYLCKCPSVSVLKKLEIYQILMSNVWLDSFYICLYMPRLVRQFTNLMFHTISGILSISLPPWMLWIEISVQFKLLTEHSLLNWRNSQWGKPTGSIL